MNREELLTVLHRTVDLMAESQGPRKSWTVECLLSTMIHALETTEPMSAREGDTICNGEWLSGSGGHRVFSGQCSNPATWRELDGGAQFCDEHARAVIAPEPVSAPVEDGPDVIRNASGFQCRLVAAKADKGTPIVVDEHDYWFPFIERENKVTAAKLQAFWRANYRFAVDETFDEETCRVVKLAANQGRTTDGADGDVVTFEWCEEEPVAWFPKGIEIVDGVPRYRETPKVPEASYVDGSGERWHFVETPGGWVAVCAIERGALAYHVLENGFPAMALRDYLNAKGIEWRKDGGA